MIQVLKRLGAPRFARCAERGAIGVEYALLVALFAVTVIAAVDSLQGSAEDRFAASSEDAGAPVEVNGVYSERTPPPTGGGPGETTPGPTPVTGGSVTISGGSGIPASGQRWDASVTVYAAVDGAPVADVVVVLAWSGDQTGSVELLTGPDGNATHTIADIHKNDELTFTVTGATKPDHTFVVSGSSLTLDQSS